MFIAHMLSLIFSGCVIVVADHDGFLWFRGKKETLNASRVELLHQLTWIGLTLLVVTGFFLFYPARNFLLKNPVFAIKMIFVALLIGNGFIIGKLSRVAKTKSFVSLQKGEKAKLLISGAISATSWIGATIAAFFLFN